MPVSINNFRGLTIEQVKCKFLGFTMSYVEDIGLNHKMESFVCIPHPIKRTVAKKVRRDVILQLYVSARFTV
jgi:hypothetical protein